MPTGLARARRPAAAHKRPFLDTAAPSRLSGRRGCSQDRAGPGEAEPRGSAAHLSSMPTGLTLVLQHPRPPRGNRAAAPIRRDPRTRFLPRASSNSSRPLIRLWTNTALSEGGKRRNYLVIQPDLSLERVRREPRAMLAALHSP